MQFEQRQLTRRTLLALRRHGLYLCQRDGRGHVRLEFEMPYEELLPLRTERRSSVPRQQLLGLLFALLWGGSNLARQFDLSQQPSSNFWLGALAAAAGFGLFVLYGLQNWWRHTVLSTPRLHVVLADRRSDRAALRQFEQQLEKRTKAYLREEYGQVNPLGIIEPQLRRLSWLRQLDVLGAAEAEALATRLTGQVRRAPFRSMGQVLEQPYVN